MKLATWARSALFIVLLAPLASGAKPAPKAEGKAPAYLTVETAGPDFPIQGEYVGPADASAQKLGAQVIALGNGEFQAVFLAGGLPGEGYDGKSRVEVPGKSGTAAGEASFSGDSADYTGSIAAGVFHVKTKDGKTLELKKVERKSSEEGAKPPPGATVLFDGTDVSHWKNGKMDDRHLLMIDAETAKPYQNFTLHLEFLLPFKPLGRDQDRGNSGIYIQHRYEVQVLDTFGHPTEFNGCGSMYRQHAPLVNMCYPPLSWQTYDIDFQAPKFDDAGKKTHNAVITVKQNGVVVQDQYEITGKTGAGKPEGPNPAPIWLQAHGNPVFYRNIWIIEK